MGRASSVGTALAAKSGWLIAAIPTAAAAALLAMGRSAICPCGRIRPWHGVVQSPENSQQLSDWYSFSHVVHGFLFYAGARWLLGRWPWRARLVIAAGLEAGWELLENSPPVIDRYRSVTMAYGYAGDSVLNSLSDIGMMVLGFALARRLPSWLTVALAGGFELFTLWGRSGTI